MNLETKIIITDTNIITDLNNANILEKFVNLGNVYVSDLIKNDELNKKTGDLNVLKKFKVIESTSEQILEAQMLTKQEKGLSLYDVHNFILVRDNNAILATGDNRLRKYSINSGVEVIRTLRIIKMMTEINSITNEEAIKACKMLKSVNTTRIPETDIDNLILQLQKELVIN